MVEENKTILRMIIALDETRMKKDGYNPEKLWEEINNLAKESEIDNYKIESKQKGIYETENNGVREWFIDLLEENNLFMKYVNKWEIKDPTIYDNVIESYKEMGIKCCYE